MLGSWCLLTTCPCALPLTVAGPATFHFLFKLGDLPVTVWPATSSAAWDGFHRSLTTLILRAATTRTSPASCSQMPSQDASRARREKVLKAPCRKPKVEGVTPKAKPQESAASSSRMPLLRRPSQSQALLTPRVSGGVLDLAAEPKLDVIASQMKKRKRDESSSSSTSSTASCKEKKSAANLRGRARRRSKLMVDQMMEGQNLSLLESRAVMVSTSKQYSQELNQFMDFARPRGLDTKDEMMMDGMMVEYLNHLFLQGHQSYRADRLIAAVLHYYPEYGRMGAKRLPRTWKAIRGYRKLTPGKSRKAYPLALWCAMAVELKKQQRLRMSVFLMLSISTYARPSELMRARLFSLVRPHSGVTGDWSMLLSPDEQGTQTKTGEFDTSLILDSPYLRGWGDRLFEELKKGHPRGEAMGLRLRRVQSQLRGGSKETRCSHHPISNQTLRAIHRQKPRSMAIPQVSQQIREECKVGSYMGAAASCPEEPLSTMRSRPWGTSFRPKGAARLSQGARMNGNRKYFLDLFAGKAGVAKAVQKLGYSARVFDIKNGLEQDLTNRRVQNRIIREIKRKRIFAVMLAPVCTSFSVARDRTKVIRNKQYPWGILREQLTEKEWQSILLGNRCFRACLRIMRILDQYRIPYILENPASSKAWFLPPVQSHIRQSHVQFITCDFCQFGARWKKPRSFICGHVDPLD